MPGGRARSALRAGAGTRFTDVRWVAQTGSTNADAIRMARAGAPEGLVIVADHQTAGRGRAGRTWTAPPGASLLLSALLRPPLAVMDLSTMAVSVAACEAVATVAGFAPRVKWPNDLVWPGDGSAPDRKLAGVLAEADPPTTRDGRATVVVGIGINVHWPAELPVDLAEIAVACNHIVDVPPRRDALLVEILRRLDHWYGLMVAGDRSSLLDAWRDRSATLGRRVRADLAEGAVEGTATDITASGHLVIATSAGERTVAVGDVVHLRST